MNTPITAEKAIQHTKNWLKTVIIAHNICPFAKREFDKESIHYEVIHSAEMEEQLQSLISNCQLLDSDKNL
ncbi:MAG TPA: DUF1415 family protein, partial [Leucothrix sp.]|nr:DUF1415 family protein [Leucothrix sp.]